MLYVYYSITIHTHLRHAGSNTLSHPFHDIIQSISHLIRPGDIVSIAPSSDDDPNSQLASGVVSGDSETLDDSVQYRLVKQANDITYRQLKRYWAQFYKEFYDKS